MFKQMLEKFRKTEFNLFYLVIAAEIESACEGYLLTVTDEQYEILCETVLDYYLKVGESEVREIIQKLFDGLDEGKISFNDYKTWYNYLKEEFNK